MRVTPIKLFKAGELSDGTQRFQSQLSVGKGSADFIMDPDGTMKHWENGQNGFNFYPYSKPYQIVSNISEMSTQIL